MTMVSQEDTAHLEIFETSFFISCYTRAFLYKIKIICLGGSSTSKILALQL